MTVDRHLAHFAAMEMERSSQSTGPSCKVCSDSTKLFDVIDFGRQCHAKIYPDGLTGIGIYYHQCVNCGLIFSEFFDHFTDEMWRMYIYNKEYERIDPDYLSNRSIRNVSLVQSVVKSFWTKEDRGCDFGGGQGMTARLLSNLGIEFDSFDPFGVDTREDDSTKFRLVTVFEVLEHSPTPGKTFAKIAQLCKDDCALVLASTALIPNRIRSGSLSRWWYAAPRNGHITLYSEKSLKLLAEGQGFTYRKVTRGIHLFGRGIDLARASRALIVAKVLQRLGLK